MLGRCDLRVARCTRSRVLRVYRLFFVSLHNCPVAGHTAKGREYIPQSMEVMGGQFGEDGSESEKFKPARG